jgi:biotin transport system substrate-specific component
MFLAMLLGSRVIFAAGLAQLSRFVPAGTLLSTGLLPFVPGDLLKSALAAGLFPVTWKLAGGAETK